MVDCDETPREAPIRFVEGARVWALHATHGFPLELSLSLMWDRYHAMPLWQGLLEAARADGVNPSAFQRRLDAIIGDAYPPQVAARVREGMRQLTEGRN